MRGKMKIRTATMDDYDNLCKLFTQGDKLHADLVPEVFQEFPGPPRPRDLLQHFIDNDDADIIVVEHEDEIVGLLSLEMTDYPSYPLFRRRPYVMIHSLVVEETQRRLGVGSSLLQAAQDWARRRGVRYLQANVWSANTIALDFYTRHAFDTLTQKIELVIDMDEELARR